MMAVLALFFGLRGLAEIIGGWGLYIGGPPHRSLIWAEVTASYPRHIFPEQMTPVLGYGRVDGERARSESPQSYNSQHSPPPINLLQRLRSRDHGDQDTKPTPAKSAPPHPGSAPANGDTSSGGHNGSQNHAGRSSTGARGPDAKPLNINDYCFGTPKKVGQSHSGGVELFMCTQENAVFLPSVRRSRRSRRYRESYEAPPSEPEPNGEPNEPSGSGDGGDPTSDGPDGAYDAAYDNFDGDGDGDRPLRVPSSDDDNMDPGNLGNLGNRAAEAGADQADHSVHSGGVSDEDSTACSMLRGSVVLRLAKPTKIKEIGVNFYCLSRTLWSLLSQSSVLADSTLPNNAQVEDSAYLGIHHWDFVPLEQFGTAQAHYDKHAAGQSSTLIGQDLFGADVALLKDHPGTAQHRKYSRVYNSQACRVRGRSAHPVPVFGPLRSRPRKLKSNSVQSDGVVFPAGSYVYNFALLIDHKTPGSIRVPNGEVKFVLSARVVRTGAFNMNISGQTEVDVVRAPPEASAEGAVFGLSNDSVLLSRVWNDRFVYSLSMDHRNLTQDVPTRMTLSVLPLSDPDVRLHQVQVFALETVTYVYSLDPNIRFVDPDLKLLLFQKDAPESSGSLLQPEDATTISADLTLVSIHNRHPHRHALQPFQRGRYGEMRFIEPDVKGPYVSVRHRLMLLMRVSRASDVDDSRCHYEVKIDTPITVLSRHCISDNVHLPSYEMGVQGELEHPPSFDDAMTHELLGRPGADSLPRRGDKADYAEAEA